MSGVSSEGFIAKRFDEVLTDAGQQLETIADPLTGEYLQADFGSEDPAMQVVQVPLEATAEAWQAIQLSYQQFDPSKSTGPSLYGLVQLNGISQQDETASKSAIEMIGTPGAIIPAGLLISDENNNNQWGTDSEVTLDVSGEGYVGVTCTVVGPVVALAETLTSIVNPYPGLTSVNNPFDAVPGRFLETDTELRQRQKRSTMAPAASPVESVYGNLADIPGVTYARVRQNNTLVTDANGIPGKSVAAVVVGGADIDIAYTLLARTGVTASWFGTSSQVLFDEQNEPYDVRWTRPTPIPVYIQMQIEIYNTKQFPADGIQRIKDAIIAYAAGGAPALGVEDGFSDTGFPPGAEVILSRLYTPINSIAGHRVVSNSLLIGTSVGTLGEDDIPTPWNQYPLFLADNIDITVI